MPDTEILHYDSCSSSSGTRGSSGFPGKNTYKILGRPLMAYPLLAARRSRYVDRTYVSTDSEEIMAVGRQYDAEVIVRPRELCTDQALGEDAYAHGYRMIRDMLAESGESVEIMVLLFANAATVTGQAHRSGDRNTSSRSFPGFRRHCLSVQHVESAPSPNGGREGVPASLSFPLRPSAIRGLSTVIAILKGTFGLQIWESRWFGHIA